MSSNLRYIFWRSRRKKKKKKHVFLVIRIEFRRNAVKRILVRSCLLVYRKYNCKYCDRIVYYYVSYQIRRLSYKFARVPLRKMNILTANTP